MAQDEKEVKGKSLDAVIKSASNNTCWKKTMSEWTGKVGSSKGTACSARYAWTRMHGVNCIGAASISAPGS